MGKVLVIGAKGQIGTELTQALVEDRGSENVVAADLNTEGETPCAFESLDVMDNEATARILKKHDVRKVYPVGRAALGHGGKISLKARQLNMESLLFMLECAPRKNHQKTVLARPALRCSDLPHPKILRRSLR